MKRIILIAFSAIILFIVGCAGNKAAGSSRASLFSESVAEVISNEPEWWTTPEEKEGYVYGKGSGASRSKDGSRMKAKNDVINDLSQKSKVITEGRTSFFTSETGTDDDSELLEKFDNVQNTIWGGAVNGWVEIKSQTVVENTQDQQGKKKTIYRTYILGAIDQGAADKKLLAQINRDKDLRTAFEASKAQDKLEDELTKYKDSFKY
ncbi:MAG: hypothetical protein HOO10_09465 [Candidatus Marinimicrobia bacterium]|jgi:hypothetical protein|nr:hypothetical protein [Candidatus Neomarinimicrobiota bacterium]